MLHSSRSGRVLQNSEMRKSIPKLAGIMQMTVTRAKIIVKRTVLGGPSGLQEEAVVMVVDEMLLITVTEVDLKAHSGFAVYLLNGVVQSLSVV
jgi:hypothetical protein